MSADSKTTPALDVLSLLQRYEALHENASTSLKGTFWNITKARRQRGFQAGGGGFGGTEYSVDNVREELRAHTILEVKDEDDGPNLVAENHAPLNNCDEEVKDESGNFILHFDGIEEAQRAERETVEKTIVDPNDREGLRRRNKAITSSSNDGQTKSGSSAWTSEEHLDEEEDELRKADPLCLFGVPPPALRVAQSESRDALSYYVEVANLAKEMMRIINEGNKK